MRRTTVVNPHLEEIDNIQRRIHELEEYISDEKKTNMKLRHEAEVKLGLLARMDEALEKQHMEHKWVVVDFKARMQKKEEDFKMTQTDLQEEIDALYLENSVHSSVEGHNQMLHSRLKEISKTYFEEKAKMDEELDENKRYSFDVRMSMEKIARKMRRDLIYGYKAQAVESMKDKIAIAQQENEKLHRIRNAKNDKCNQLMKNQAQGYERSKWAHIEMEVMTTSANLQAKEKQALEHRIETQKDHYEQVEKEYIDLFDAVEELKLCYAKKLETSQGLESAADQLMRFIRKRDRLKRITTNTVQRMVEDAMKQTEKQLEIESDALITHVLGSSSSKEMNEDDLDDNANTSWNDELVELATATSRILDSHSRSTTTMNDDPEMAWNTKKISNEMLFSAPLRHYLQITRRDKIPVYSQTQ